jgi:hypothetical protein
VQQGLLQLCICHSLCVYVSCLLVHAQLLLAVPTLCEHLQMPLCLMLLTLPCTSSHSAMPACMCIQQQQQQPGLQEAGLEVAATQKHGTAAYGHASQGG